MTTYYIQKVRKNDDGDIIVVKTLYNEFTREEVIEKIKSKKHFFVVQDGDSKITVEVIPREGKEYIRTVKDGKETNNLDELQEF